MASAVARAESKALRSVPSMFLISKSGPKAETVAGESSSAMRTIGLGKVRTFELGKEKGKAATLELSASILVISVQGGLVCRSKGYYTQIKREA